MNYFKPILSIMVLVAASLLCVACARDPAAYYEIGKYDYALQDYHSAFENLLESAKWRNADAQYAVGYMYYYGIGTAQNLPQAVYWFKQAAQQGQPRALQALETIQADVPDNMLFMNGMPYAGNVANSPETAQNKSVSAKMTLPKP